MSIPFTARRHAVALAAGIAAAAVLMPRESVHTSTVLLNAEGH